MKTEHPVPVTTSLTAEHVESAAEGEFTIQQCQDDATYWYPPSPYCPSCLGTRFVWRGVSGQAKLWSWVVMHQPYIPAFTDEIPYLVAYVQLEEGPLLISTVIDAEPEELEVGMDLQVDIDFYGPDHTPMPVFRRA